MMGEQQEGQNALKTRFDLCTIRQWFMEMDIDQTGSVTKDGFMTFLRDRPQLRSLMLAHAPAKNNGKPARVVSQRESEALEMRRLLKVLKDIDEDKNGTLEWEEFVEFFRRSGYLLEYSTKENPREKIADVLGQIHEKKIEGEDVEDDLLDKLNKMAGSHMNDQARRKSQDITDQESGESISPLMRGGGRRRASEGSLPGLQQSLAAMAASQLILGDGTHRSALGRRRSAA